MTYNEFYENFWPVENKDFFYYCVDTDFTYYDAEERDDLEAIAADAWEAFKASHPGEVVA